MPTDRFFSLARLLPTYSLRIDDIIFDRQEREGFCSRSEAISLKAQWCQSEDALEQFITKLWTEGSARVKRAIIF